MLFSYTQLQEHIAEKLPSPEKLAHLLYTHSFEVEDIVKKGRDWIFDVDILPNRGDCMGHLGLAREISVITKKKMLQRPVISLKAIKGSLAPIKVQQQSSSLQRQSAIVIEGVKVGKSPQWLKKRLQALGINSINNIVDLTNYILVDTGQPLHAFDYDAIQGKNMVFKDAKVGEVFVDLDEKKLKLPGGALVIEDSKEIIDLVGMKGGKGSCVQAATKNVILQAPSINPKTIYQTKKALGYTTPAADIFSYGISPENTLSALEQALSLLHKIAGGKVVQIIEQYLQKHRSPRIKTDTSFIQRFLGTKIPGKEIQQILERLGCKVTLSKGGVLTITPPAWRLDLTIPEDMVEEVGRIYGYEKIGDEMPSVSLSRVEPDKSFVWADRMKDFLKESGFIEMYNFSFVGEKTLKDFSYTKKNTAALIELANPISEEYRYLRDTLLVGLVKNIAGNQRANATQELRLAEVGTVFFEQKGKKQEHLMVAGVIAPAQRSTEPFYAGKGAVEQLLERLGVMNVWYDDFQVLFNEHADSLWHQGKTAEVKLGKEKIGFVGEISSRALHALKIKRKVAAFQLDLGRLIKEASEERGYEEPSRFPAALRDIAILVPQETKVVDVMNRMHEAGGKLIADIDLFDLYEGDQISKGMKNLAFHLMYQAKDRTLTAKEVDTLHEKITKALEENPAWEVRK